MTLLYVVGGQQRSERTLIEGNGNWEGYRQGLVIRVDVETGVGEPLLSYVSPADARNPEDPMLFKSGSLVGRELYLCTTTEVMRLNLPDTTPAQYVSLPYFNDLHHVHPTNWGTLLVANSGLEMVLELTWEGQVIRAWNTLGEEPWSTVDHNLDYRKGISTKPHRSHPNYVFTTDEDVWATRFHQRDALCLTRPERRIEIGLQNVHDGVVAGDLVYFTTVDCKIIVANHRTLAIEDVIDITSMHDANLQLGWCRSLLMDGPRIWVGFSRIRPTKLRENVSWVMNRFRQPQPTRIAYYDLERRRCLREIDLEPYGLNAVFSIMNDPIGR